MKFKGKVSWWFYAMMIGVAVLLAPMIVHAFTDTNITVLIITISLLAAVEIFSVPIALHNYVELQDETLLIVFGLIKYLSLIKTGSSVK